MESDRERKRPHTPHGQLLATPGYASSASIGADSFKNAGSFCERVLSAANLVVTDGNTLLSTEEVEMLSVLRINRRFMQIMRSLYAKEANQQFNLTVVEEEEDTAAAPAASAGACPSG